MRFKILRFKKLSSTNKRAKLLAKKRLFDVVVVADEQTKGKGRFNRKWFSSKGGLYLSILLKEQDVGNAKYLTFISALSVVKAIEKVTGLKAKIKWPNDVHFNGKKLCGILTESFSGKEGYVVLGAGINVNQLTFNTKISNIATSIKKELKTRENQRFSVSRKSSISVKPIDKEKILNKFLEEFSLLYKQYKNKKYKKILDLLKKNCDTIGREAKVKTLKKEFYGKVIDIDEECNLILRLKNNKIKKIIEGDIFVLD